MFYQELINEILDLASVKTSKMQGGTRLRMPRLTAFIGGPHDITRCSFVYMFRTEDDNSYNKEIGIQFNAALGWLPQTRTVLDLKHRFISSKAEQEFSDALSEMSNLIHLISKPCCPDLSDLIMDQELIWCNWSGRYWQRIWKGYNLEKPWETRSAVVTHCDCGQILPQLHFVDLPVFSSENRFDMLGKL